MTLNNYILIAAALGSLSSFSCLAAKDRVLERSVQYKCHLTLQDGTELVNYRMSKPNNAKKLTSGLGSGFIYAKNGVTKRGIRKAHECVLATETFRSDKAKALDEQTLR